MSKHTEALVPIEAWAYGSPELRLRDKRVDLGLLAEALIYFDRVHLNIATQPHLADLLQWVLDQEAFGILRSLIYDGIVEVYEYSFAPAPVFDQQQQTYRLLNLQDQEQAKPNTFSTRYIWHPSVREVAPATHLAQLQGALSGHVTEVKGDEFGLTIAEAETTLKDPLKTSLLLQHFVDEVYRFRGLGSPPVVAVTISQEPLGSTKIHWNMDLQALGELAGSQVGFHDGIPLAAAITTIKMLWSASRLESDLVLPRPLSSAVGDKLIEGAALATGPSATLSNLRQFAAFPDVGRAVNQGHLSLREVLRIRKKAKRFRRWLQASGERDIDQFASYHSEVGRASVLDGLSRKAVSLFGVIAGAGVSLTVPGALGAGLGAATAYSIDIGSRIGEDWRPIVFGEWLDSRLRAAVKPDAG